MWISRLWLEEKKLWLALGLGVFLLLSFLLLQLVQQHRGVRVHEISQAERTPGPGASPRPEVPNELIELPDSWNAAGRSGLWTYQMKFEVPAEATADQPWAVYIPRAGNRFLVWLNGQRIAMRGDFNGSQADFAQRPQLYYLPPELLRSGANDLRIDVQGELSRFAGLARLQVGPADALWPRFWWREVAQEYGSEALVLLALVLATVSGVLAWQRGGVLLRWFSLACLCAALRGVAMLVLEWPFDFRLGALFRDFAYATYLYTLCTFSVTALNLRHPFVPWLNLLLALSTLILVPIHAWWRILDARQAWQALTLVYAAGFTLLVVQGWWRSRSVSALVMAAASTISVSLALQDHIRFFYTQLGYAGFVLTGYSLLVYVLAMTWLLVDDELRQLRQDDAERLRQHFELERHRAELERRFEDEQRLAAEKAKQHARQRILGDVHDGIGLQLNSLLRRAEVGACDPSDLAREVRITIDQLRLLVESNENFDGDVAMLLAQARQQLERRLRHAGIRLEWQIHLQHPDRRLDPAVAISLQRLLFELATNAIKHSHAKQVRVEVVDPPLTPHALALCFADDGIGFGVDAPSEGSRAVNRRLQEIGAQLSFHTQESGVRYDITFPDAIFLPGATTEPIWEDRVQLPGSVTGIQ